MSRRARRKIMPVSLVGYKYNCEAQREVPNAGGEVSLKIHLAVLSDYYN